MEDFWSGRRVLVTGGGGFVGSFVVEALVKRGVRPRDIVVPRSRDCDLRIFENCRRVTAGCDVVIHLAAASGGIAYSSAHPATQYYACSVMNLHMVEAARQAGVKRFMAVGNLLAYPAAAAMPLTEWALHDGAIASTHIGIGLSKRDLVMLAQMYHREFGLDIVGVLAANAYGPRDRFDPRHSHVIPATIMKCFADEDLIVWGDGSPTRDFLYVDDLAEGIVVATERLRAPEFINLGSGHEVSIRELVSLIAKLSGFERRIVFDAARGSGDPRRVASTTHASEIGFAPRHDLVTGLRITIDWYKTHARAVTGRRS
jgi:GDP-L-fucose synthase